MDRRTSPTASVAASILTSHLPDGLSEFGTSSPAILQQHLRPQPHLATQELGTTVPTRDAMRTDTLCVLASTGDVTDISGVIRVAHSLPALAGLSLHRS